MTEPWAGLIRSLQSSGAGCGRGEGGGLACSTPSAIGPDRRGHRGVACTRSEPRALGAKCSVTLALERLTMGNPRFLCTRSPNGRGLAPIGTGQHQICLVRPFLSRKAIFFWVLWAPYLLSLTHSFSHSLDSLTPSHDSRAAARVWLYSDVN